MGAENTVVNQWLSRKERFADLFNGIVFGGEQIVRPEGLEAVDRESDLVIKDKAGKRQEVRRYRDIVMSWKRETNLAVLACESQRGVDYAMPVRTMVYDGLSYTEQLRRAWEGAGPEEKLTREEYLSRCRKDTRLTPALTLVFYYGSEAWDGSRSLYEMFGFPEQGADAERMKKYIPDYRLNLIEGRNIKDAKRFRSDLRILFEMLKCRGDKEALSRCIREHESYFEGVDRETWEAYQEFLQIGDKRMNAFFDKNIEGDTVNMCKALEDLYADGVAEGRAAGREEGRAAGREEGWAAGREEGRIAGREEGREAGRAEMKKKIIRNMLERGIADTDICLLAGCIQSMVDEVRREGDAEPAAR